MTSNKETSINSERDLIKGYNEVTGPTCSGKTFRYRKAKCTKQASKLFFAFGFIYCLFFHFDAFRLLSVKSLRSDRSLYFITTIFLNVFAKIGFIMYCKYSDRDILVDEGVSHIPFILWLDEKETNRLVNSLESIFSLIKVKFFECGHDIIIDRLQKRGHKRVRSKNDLECMWKNHVTIMNFYPNVLKGKVKSIEILQCTPYMN